LIIPTLFIRGRFDVIYRGPETMRWADRKQAYTRHPNGGIVGLVRN
jgi:hypothetical protein